MHAPTAQECRRGFVRMRGHGQQHTAAARSSKHAQAAPAAAVALPGATRDCLCYPQPCSQCRTKCKHVCVCVCVYVVLSEKFWPGAEPALGSQFPRSELRVAVDCRLAAHQMQDDW